MIPKPKDAPPILLLVLLFSILSLLATRGAGSNVLVRFATAVRIVEDGTPELGRFAKLTSDGAVTARGTYSDKAPGVSFLLIPAYALVRLVTRDFDFARHLCRMLTLIPLVLLAGMYLWKRLPDWGVDEDFRPVVLTALAVGSYAWPFYSMLYSHGFTAALILIGTLALVSYRGRDRESASLLAVSGLCFGAAVAMEYPAAVLGAPAGVYLLSFERRASRVAIFAAAGALLPAAAIMAFNYAAFGRPFHLGYLNEVQPHYTEAMSRGIMGIGLPKLSNLGLLLLSPSKGLFFWSPVSIFGVIGAGAMIRKRPREGLLLTGMIAGYAILLSGYFEAGGGACLGPRHLAPIAGLLILAGAWHAARLGETWKGIYAGAAVASSLLLAAGVFTDPQMQERLVNPLWDFSIPMLAEGVGPGNILGLPDRLASLAAFGLVGVVWLAALRRRGGAADSHRAFRAGALGGLALLAAFYLLASPNFARTDPGTLHQILGNQFMARKDYPRAAREYRQAWEARKDPWILYYRSKALYQAGDMEGAAAALKELEDFYPDFLLTTPGPSGT